MDAPRSDPGDVSLSTPFEFVDEWPVPDSVATDYRQVVDSRGHPAVVIDNGTHCIVGWSGESAPRVQFPNITAKPKVRKGPDVTSVGNSITADQFNKWVVTGPLEMGVPTNFDVQEILLDHAFELLGIDDDRVNHPVVMTEAPCCPNSARAGMTELLLEGYQAPSVAYGLADLFSLHHNRPETGRGTGLVVSVGYESSHVLPVVEGRLDSTRTARIELGGFNLLQAMFKLVRIAKSDVEGLTYHRVRQLVDRLGYVAPDYSVELDLWTSDPSYARTRSVCVQMPCDVHSAVPLVDSTRETPIEVERRHEANAERLREMHRVRRSEKLDSCRRRAAVLRIARGQMAGASDVDIHAALQEVELDSAEALSSELEQLEREIEQLETRVFADAASPVTMPNASVRKRARSSVMDERRLESDPEQWLRDIRAERRRVASIVEGRRANSAAGDGAAADLNIESAARGDNEDEDDDDDDEKNNDDLARRVRELDNLLVRHEANIVALSRRRAEAELRQQHQVMLRTERVRVPEILFQPHIIGSPAAGLGEVLEWTFAKFPPDVASALAANVFVTGRESRLPGLVERVQREIRGMRPADTPVAVFAAADAAVDGWRGASSWASSVDLAAVSITREWYQEHGADRLVEHGASNQFVYMS